MMFQGLATVSGAHGAGAHPTNVRCEEYDGRMRSATRQISHGSRGVSRQDVDEGGGRADAQHPE